MSKGELLPPSVRLSGGCLFVPPGYAEDSPDRVCDGVANGRSLAEICGRDGVPPVEVVRRWLRADSGFRDAYMAAFQLRALSEVTQVYEIADLTDEDESVSRSRLRVDVRMKLAERLWPRQFGSKKAVEHVVSADVADAMREAVNRGHGLPSASVLGEGDE